MTTGLAQDYWAGRHTTYAEDPRAWCVHYWESWTNPYRWTLAEAIKSCQPASVLELGCNVGPNLHVLRQALGPDVPLIGVDVNKSAIEFGRQQFAALGDTETILAEADFFSGLMALGPIDVICSCYALAYLAPGDAVLDVVREAWRKATRALVFAEPTSLTLPRFTDAAIGEWAHNYAAVFAALGIAPRHIQYRVLSVPGTHLDGLWVVRKESP